MMREFHQICSHIQENPPAAILYTIITLTLTLILTQGLILDNAEVTTTRRDQIRSKLLVQKCTFLAKS